MPKSATTSRKRPTPHPAEPPRGERAVKRSAGRPPRDPKFERRQVVVNAALLDEAMRYTGLGQSDTINAALARFAENAYILEGIDSLAGAFPNWPGHGEELDEGRNEERIENGDSGAR